MAANERRIGNINMVRAYGDRREYCDPNYNGPERRCGQERRIEKDRRKKDMNH
jgi:hypothetical protein